jgi:uncharacterized protein YprB with RNaseH-like and TPR domain
MEPADKQKRLRELRSELSRLTKGWAGSRLPAADLRRSALQRVAERARPAGAAPQEPLVYRRDLPRVIPAAAAPAAGAPRARQGRVDLSEAFPTGREVGSERGVLFEVRQPAEEVDGVVGLDAAFGRELLAGDSPLCRCIGRACEAGALQPSDLLFMDIETTGLSNSPLFLIGIMGCWEGRLEVRQFFARDYAEEAAVIARFVQDAAAKRVVVSFNGKSFDVPYVRNRAVAHRVDFRLAEAHVDLLHESRRRWRGVLPDCRLQTLEQRVCRHAPRTGDIPGSEIPAAYHAYVRSNDAWQMVDTLRHNARDLVTLAELLLRLDAEV